MTKTKIIALLSVLALLAALPLAVAFAQEGGEGGENGEGEQQQPSAPTLPYTVVGNAMIDDAAAMAGVMVSAMVGDEMVGEGEVGMDGKFSIDIDGGEMGAMIMFSLTTGEGDAMMELMAATSPDVMVGTPGGVALTNLSA